MSGYMKVKWICVQMCESVSCEKGRLEMYGERHCVNNVLKPLNIPWNILRHCDMKVNITSVFIVNINYSYLFRRASENQWSLVTLLLRCHPTVSTTTFFFTTLKWSINWNCFQRIFCYYHFDRGSYLIIYSENRRKYYEFPYP